MPIWALFALGNLKHDMGLLWTWLSHRSFWQLVSMALAGFALVQHFEIAHARKDAAAYLKQRDGYKSQFDGISTKRNDQQTVTRDTIKVVTKTIHDADQRAQIVEKAPAAPDCKTKPEVLQADL